MADLVYMEQRKKKENFLTNHTLEAHSKILKMYRKIKA